jgi:hypothetical protein
MGCTACTEPQCLYKGDLYLFFIKEGKELSIIITVILVPGLEKRAIYNKIYTYAVEHNNVFIALVATSFGLYDHHQGNAVQNYKNVQLCATQYNIITLTSSSVFFNSLKCLH